MGIVLSASIGSFYSFQSLELSALSSQFKAHCPICYPPSTTLSTGGHGKPPMHINFSKIADFASVNTSSPNAPPASPPFPLPTLPPSRPQTARSSLLLSNLLCKMFNPRPSAPLRFFVPMAKWLSRPRPRQTA